MNCLLSTLTDSQVKELYGDVIVEMKRRDMDVEKVERRRVVESIKVRVHVWSDDPFTLDKYGHYYSFFFVQPNGDVIDFYSNYAGEGIKLNPAKLIPYGFNEAMENAYHFRGNHDEAMNALAEVGIVDILETPPNY